MNYYVIFLVHGSSKSFTLDPQNFNANLSHKDASKLAKFINLSSYSQLLMGSIMSIMRVIFIPEF